MKRFLVACDHEKRTVDGLDPWDAKQQCRCKKCVVFDLQKERWMYRGVRVYEESAQIEAKRLPAVRAKHDEVEQLDWIGR